MIELLPFALLVVYVLPFLVGAARGLDAMPLLLIANLLVGWTGIGWLAVMAWAALSPAPGPLAVGAERASSNR
jgi:hypothetical protein